MAEELPMTEAFSLNLDWPPPPGKGGIRVLDESIGRFEIVIGEKSLTSYRTEKGDTNSRLTIPTYYLVEWLALNWWSFLYEPRKYEREDAEQDFRLRHWLGSARNGFALPDVMFSPSGERIEIVSRPVYLRFAGLTFTEAVMALVKTEEVRAQFSDFIGRVLARLTEKGVKNTEAHEAWRRVINTDTEEEAYCRLVGSLGASPYVDHPELDAALDKIAGKVSESMLEDLCQATSIGNFDRAAEFTNGISQTLLHAQPVPAHELFSTQRPYDRTPRAYEWGYHAADVARASLGIAHDDPAGANSFFQQLRLDPTSGSDNGSELVNVISGAVTREGNDMRLALTATNAAHRKFAAARASFLAWSQQKHCSRLVTAARTRDQQASRAFAAELLAPARYLKRRLGDRSDVSPFTLDKISDDMGIAPTVVHYQAKNHGYYVADAA